jgi:hypothetical protein
MKRLYFGALVLGFVGFFGTHINAQAFRLSTVNCPSKLHCDLHNVDAWFVMDERINDHPYRRYAHGKGSTRHEMRRRCDE